MTVGHGWEAKLTGEVLILGRVIERLGLIIRILSMANSGFVPDGCIEPCGEIIIKTLFKSSKTKKCKAADRKHN